jgi:hypothetical protein
MEFSISFLPFIYELDVGEGEAQKGGGEVAEESQR